MKTSFVCLLLLVSFSLQAQFIYKNSIRKPDLTSSPTKRSSSPSATSPGGVITISGLTTTGTVDISQLSTTGTLVISGISPTATINFDGLSITKNKREKKNMLAQSAGPAVIFGGGNGETIVVSELLSANIGANGEYGRLGLGGCYTKTAEASTGELKALMQGGGNTFISHSAQIIAKNNDDIGYIMLLSRTKLGAVLPAIGSSTTSIQAYFDPGVECQFSVGAKKDKVEVIGLVGTLRLGGIWASKEYSDKLKLTTNFLPYVFVSGGVRVANSVQIVYSHQFFNKNNLMTDGVSPAASLGVSLVL